MTDTGGCNSNCISTSLQLPMPHKTNDKCNEKEGSYCCRKRTKLAILLLCIISGALIVGYLTSPDPQPDAHLHRIPIRYTQPEILTPEDREVLSDVRTSFVPTGPIALPPTDYLQDLIERQSEEIMLSRRHHLENIRVENVDLTEQNKQIKSHRNDIGLRNSEQSATESHRRQQYSNLNTSESYVNGREKRESPSTNLTAELIWQTNPLIKSNFTLEQDIIVKWQDTTVDADMQTSESPLSEIQDELNVKEEEVGETEQSNRSPSASHKFWNSKGDPENIRKTQAEVMMQYMDLNADPCNDFYQYACGNWAPRNPIPADKAGFDTFEMLRENLDNVLNDLLSSERVHYTKQADKAEVLSFDIENNILRSEVTQNQKEGSRSENGASNFGYPSQLNENVLIERLKRRTPRKDSTFLKISSANIMSSTKHIRDLSQTSKISHEEENRSSIIEKLNKNETNEAEKRSVNDDIFKLNSSDNKKIVKRNAVDDINSNAKIDDIVELNDDATVKAIYLYKSCMNSEILEKRSHQPLLDLLDTFGGWPVLQSEWNDTDFDWIELTGRLRLYNNDILLSEWVGPDIKNSDEYVIQIDQTSLGLPTRDYFLNINNNAYLEAYKMYLIKILTLLGSTYENATKNAEDIINFERRLAAITASPEDRRNVSELYQRLTIEELHESVPQIAWQKYLSIVLNRTAANNETVVMFALKYIQDLVVLLDKTEPKTIKNYLLWRFVRHRVNNLDDRFQEAKQRFYYILLGREQAPPRWKNCVTQVNSNMGMALGSMFVKKYFDENSKNDTLVMTREIQKSFRELLNMTSWIDNETKVLAGDKVDAMMLRIGYPDFILNQKDLNQLYKEVSLHPDTYFENTLNILQHLTRTEQARLGQPVNKSRWDTAPAVVNAYYSRNKNQILFPAGILQPPFYHRYFPKSLNFGGIGVVIGHEITHGFDDKGRLFDKYGNLHRWWQDVSIDAFHQKSQCLIEQYGRYMISETSMFLNGINTQGENIADNGGVKQAFRAYQHWLSQNGNVDETLPGLNATNAQLFFLNFAQVWCGAMRPEAMRNKLKTAVHSPGKFRVIGTLSNSEDFANEFQCPLGSPMNPVNKCQVW